MDLRWPERGPWVVAATSTSVDWRRVAAAIAATSQVRVAAVVLGAAVPHDDPIRPYLVGLLELSGVNRISLRQAHDLLRATERAYEIVLVMAPAGLFVPVGADDWTLADLAASVGAPVVVVTGPGPDAVNHTRLTLAALGGHSVAACVVTVGDLDEQELPVRPAGRVPAGEPVDLTAASTWLDPILQGQATPTADPVPTPGSPGTEASTDSGDVQRPDPVAADRPTVVPRRPSNPGKPVNGKKVVLALLAVFVVMVLLACGSAWWQRPDATTSSYQSVVVFSVAPQGHSPTRFVEPTPPAPPSPRSTSDACQLRGDKQKPTVTPADRATTARVNAAWRRIERWVTAHAPVAARALRPGASATQIDRLQRRMAVAFPPDLVASLRRHDGVSGITPFTLPPMHAPESLDEIYTDWRANCDALGDVGDSGSDAWWDRAFVPFAQDGGGGSLVVDQRPGGHARVGEFFEEEGTSFEGWPASITELLELTATSLESGKPFAGSYRPKVVKGELDWDILDRGTPTPST